MNELQGYSSQDTKDSKKVHLKIKSPKCKVFLFMCQCVKRLYQQHTYVMLAVSMSKWFTYTVLTTLSRCYVYAGKSIYLQKAGSYCGVNGGHRHVKFQHTARYRYNAANYLHSTQIDIIKLAREGEIWDAFCEFKYYYNDVTWASRRLR